MALIQAVQGTTLVVRTQELGFAGDGVFLSGQMDYPLTPPPTGGYPLVFILHHAGCTTLEGYNDYAALALECGYAVFRWDKRGTGRSGAGGRGSTTQDAVNAYEVALEQPDINPRRAIIVALAAGTGLLGSSYGLFARAHVPYGVVLISNLLDADAILAIDTRVHIVMSDGDWNPWQQFAEDAAAAHNSAYRHGASYYVARRASRLLVDTCDEQEAFHPGARKVMQDWLRNAHPASELI